MLIVLKLIYEKAGDDNIFYAFYLRQRFNHLVFISLHLSINRFYELDNFNHCRPF